VAKERFGHRGETRHMESHERGIGHKEKENPHLDRLHNMYVSFVFLKLFYKTNK